MTDADDTTYWALKAACPRCGQAHGPMLVTCPLCRHVFAVCTACGCVFPDPSDPSETGDAIDGIAWTGAMPCPACGEETELAVAALHDLVKAGLDGNAVELERG